MSTDEADLYTDEHNATELRKAGANGTLGSWIKAHLSRSDSGDYVALLAYIARDPGTIGALQKMRLAVRDTRHVATCLGFGPRFLHSTGQVYKGGPNSGVFLQITCDDATDIRHPQPKIQLGHGEGGAGARRFRCPCELAASRLAGACRIGHVMGADHAEEAAFGEVLS